MRSILELFNKQSRLPFDQSPEAPSVRNFLVFSRSLPKKLKHIIISTIGLGAIFVTIGVVIASNKFLVTVPTRGGSISEGIIGTPRFVNPLLAISNADKDMVALVYSGLLRSGKLERYQPDLAENYSVSHDGTVYTFKLRENLYWHDGTPFTARDVVFSIQMAQDDRVKSPKRSSWDGVQVEAVNDLSVKITLKEPYAPFIENTTMGILPEHLWKTVLPEEFALNVFNLKPIGTGPYKVTATEVDATGVPVSIQLAAFDNFALGAPKIESLEINFYTSEEELLKASKSNPKMNISGLSAEAYQELTSKTSEPNTYKLPRVFAVFFNQNQSAVLADKNVREALRLATPKSKIVELALGGLGEVIDGPLPNTDLVVDKDVRDPAEILESAGWTLGPDGIRVKKQKRLRIELATSDSPELKKAAAIMSEAWKDIGVEVTIKVYESSDLNVNVIGPRKFDALLNGINIGHYPDSYAYWHSSRRLDPYYNVAQYTNSRADKALEEIRETNDRKVHKKATEIFLEEIEKDSPAIFLYAPSVVYAANPIIKNLEIPFLNGPADRFNQVYKWYMGTEDVWTVFKN